MPEGDHLMAVSDQGRSPSAARPLFVYLAVMFVILVLIAGGTSIWLTTDNSGTNALSSDSQSTTPPAPLTTPQ
jgi:hypothetical protein